MTTSSTTYCSEIDLSVITDEFSEGFSFGQSIKTCSTKNFQIVRDLREMSFVRRV